MSSGIWNMKNVVVLGDSTTHGGIVITASSTMIHEGKKVALVGDLVTCPEVGHGVTAILEGSKTVFYAGKAVAVNGSRCGCGCQVIAATTQIQTI